MSKKSTTEEFIRKAKQLHGSQYDYTRVAYINNSIDVLLVCPKHGVFNIKPKDHLQGNGCKLCGRLRGDANRTLTVGEFIEACVSVHGEVYDYSYVSAEYKNAKSVVPIICKVHGEFRQAASSHKQGHGCPDCKESGYSSAKAGYIYILEAAGVVKIGITNSSIERRLKSVTRSSGLQFKLVFNMFFEDGSIPDRIESILLRELRKEFNSPHVKFDGYSECFINAETSKIKERIIALVHKLN